MTPSITIIREPYEEPYHLHLVLEASNGRLRGRLEFYHNTDGLIQLANMLEVFPRHASDVHLFELGSERSEDSFAYYFRFRLFVTDGSGHCAIQLRMNNNRALPELELSEFCIPAVSSELIRLGKLLRRFALLEHLVLHWNRREGALYHTLEDARQAGVLDSESMYQL